MTSDVFLRNRWTKWIGTHGRNPPERVDDFAGIGKKAWRQALEIARIENFHFHDLRHTFCSNLILSGASLKDVKEMIGHSDISMTDRYSHLTLDRRALVQSNLSSHYSKQLGTYLVPNR